MIGRYLLRRNGLEVTLYRWCAALGITWEHHPSEWRIDVYLGPVMIGIWRAR